MEQQKQDAGVPDEDDYYDIDWLATMWTTYTFVILLLGLPLVYFPAHVPPILRRLYVYGKVGKVGPSSADTAPAADQYGYLRYIQLPKRTFTHFYVFASLYGTFFAAILFGAYYYLSVPAQVLIYLNTVAGRQREANVEPVAVIVVMILLLAHIYQRTYECLFVSVISGHINVFQYVVGVTFYFGCVTSLLAEAPGFTDEGFDLELFKEISWKWYQVLGTALYFWALWHQFRCSNILANLRKDSKGKVVSSRHKIPEGDWFTYVSCPHFFTEILMYVAMNLILNFQHSLWLQVLGWVCANQVVVGLLNHNWYLSTFPKYPTNRKAIIPFIL